MEQNFPENFRGAQRSSITISDFSEELATSQAHGEFLALDFDLLQQQSPTSVAIPSTENKKTPRKRFNKKSQQKMRTQKALIHLQPISASLCFGGKSTLRGTPWEDALSSSAECSPQTGKRTIKVEKQEQRTLKETKTIAFWKQFFG